MLILLGDCMKRDSFHSNELNIEPNSHTVKYDLDEKYISCMVALETFARGAFLWHSLCVGACAQFFCVPLRRRCLSLSLSYLLSHRGGKKKEISFHSHTALTTNKDIREYPKATWNCNEIIECLSVEKMSKTTAGGEFFVFSFCYRRSLSLSMCVLITMIEGNNQENQVFLITARRSNYFLHWGLWLNHPRVCYLIYRNCV